MHIQIDINIMHMMAIYYYIIIVPRLTGGHSGAAVIGRAIGRIVLIAILIVIISNKQMKR